MKMSSTSLVHWSGLASVLAAILFTVTAFLHPAGQDLTAHANPNWMLAHQIGLASIMLMQLGLVGLYARQVEKTGWLGLVGFVLAFVGTAFAGAILFLESTALPLVATQAPAIFDQANTPPAFAVPLFVLGFGLGYLLFGIATMRGGVLPRWSGLLLSIGVFLFMFAEVSMQGEFLSDAPAHVLDVLGQVVISLGLAWMGFALWTERRQPVSQGTMTAAAKSRV
jgi:hypothetical protein